ncbi:hypothetical protein CDL15_Pgr014053 [Punica granatum]|uniref:DUF4283 domain-containing protein n=1 Tax=Punica granatum TaxID=22663 RepID=A0A218WBY9_PUNGR|nr:hypothetical protein CDL15_Pgr014053 [Punica granatum]
MANSFQTSPPLSPSSSSNAHELSAEEADEIQRSTTKVKEWTPNTESPASPAVSYEDRLTGTFPGSMAGAYEEAFCIDHAYEDDTDDDIGPEDDDGEPRILLTWEEKLKLRAPWRDSLIIKLIDQPLDHNYFVQRIHSLWKPSGGLDLYDQNGKKLKIENKNCLSLFFLHYLTFIFLMLFIA